MDYERTLTADELESAYGFLLSQAIPVDRNGEVPRIAVFLELNPFAPEQIYCSAAVRRGAEAVLASKRGVPVFVRLETDRWGIAEPGAPWMWIPGPRARERPRMSAGDGTEQPRAHLGHPDARARHGRGLIGRNYDAICNDCGERFEVNEGCGMIAMPFHCDRCGKEWWWWHFGEGGPIGEPDPPPRECGGTFDVDAPPRRPGCRCDD